MIEGLTKVALVVLFLLTLAYIVVDDQDTAPNSVAATVEHESTSTVFASPTVCIGAGGEYRWKVKLDAEKPPAHIANDHKITPSDVAEWAPLEGKIHQDTPRTGKEKEFFVLTGRVLHCKVEADGDIHLELGDADGKTKWRVVVEVPVGKPWDEIRKEVFGWTNAKFPFRVESSKNLKLSHAHLLQVTGKGFYDGQHHTDKPNRRKDDSVTVWELHPVAALNVIKE